MERLTGRRVVVVIVKKKHTSQKNRIRFENTYKDKNRLNASTHVVGVTTVMVVKPAR